MPASFEVTNRCHPRRPPLTPNFVSRAMTGQNNPEPSTVLSDAQAPAPLPLPNIVGPFLHPLVVGPSLMS